MNGKKRNGNYWAVEFDGDEVRLCQFRLEGDRAVVSQCKTMPAEEFDFAMLRAQGTQGGSEEIQVLCAVPRSEVLLKPFTVPKSSDVDVRKVTALKLEQSVSSLDPATTLWGATEAEMPGESRRVRVLAATIPRSYVDGLLEKHFGDGRPALMECGALSAIRAHLASKAEPAGCELVVDAANDGLSVFVLKHGTVDLAHFIPAHQPLRMALTEIRRVILTLSGDGGAAPVERVTCLGGRAASELAEALEPSLGIPIVGGTDTARRPAPGDEDLPADWERNWHRIAGLIELATTGVPEPIDFLAAEAPRRRLQLALPDVVEGLRTSVLAVSLILLLAAAFLTQHAFAKRRNMQMSRVVMLGQKVTSDLERQQATLERLKTYRAKRYSLFRVLAEFHDLVPPSVTLDSLALNPDGTFSVSGRGKKYPEGHELASKLNASEFFESAGTPSGRRDGKTILFKTSFKLTPKGRKAKQ